MALGLRLVSICVVAGFYGAAATAHGETAGLLRPAIAEDEVSAEEPAVIPSLTIAPEEEQAPLKAMRPTLDPYAAPGIRLGGIALYPELEAATVYTSNVANSATDAKSDVGLSLRPSLRFESDWVRHSWTGRASGDFTAYLENDDFNSSQIDAASKFRLDIRRTTRAEFDASYALDQESSADSVVPDTAIGNRTDHVLAANAAIIHDFGGFEGRAKLGIERQIFEDVDLSGGLTEDNSDRNNYTPSLALRLSYTDPPALKPFVELAYAPRFHDEKFDRNGLRRDSHGITAAVGVTLDHGPLWQGEMALVYAMRDYEDPALDTIDAVGINGNLTWSPADLTSVIMTLATSLDESSSATSSGTKTWSGRIDAAHELRENLTLLGGFGVEFEKFSGGTDTTLSSNIGVEWQLNPNLAWTAGYDGTWFEAAASGGNYNEQRLMTGIVLRR
ncbi:MAG TPA: outer membrane beta-barrel protein [Aestuariivirga sp.]|nr:outer membrane beta-barrel protein [Aestuariivirga sp.]